MQPLICIVWFAILRWYYVFFSLFSALATDPVVLDVSPTYQNTVDSMLHIFQFAQLKFFNKH